MQTVPSSPWGHSHDFSIDTSAAERRTRIVIAITSAMMVVELAAGSVFHSMALLADGWHMSTHVAAFVITALAYSFSRRHATDPRYSFGTGKIGVLGGFASAVVLAMIALLMAGESLHRMLNPLPIQFNEAIGVAVIGLAVNLVCALLLQDDHPHHHPGHESSHGHSHGHHDHHHHHHHHHHHDLNRRSAYLHVLADATTSLTAILALTAGKFLGWNWLDPVMGVAGSAVVAVWAYGLVRDTSSILLDRTPESSDLPAEIRRAVESETGSVLADLHVWQLAPGRFAAIVGIASPAPQPLDHYRTLFREHAELVHVSVEVLAIPELATDQSRP